MPCVHLILTLFHPGFTCLRATHRPAGYSLSIAPVRLYRTHRLCRNIAKILIFNILFVSHIMHLKYEGDPVYPPA